VRTRIVVLLCVALITTTAAAREERVAPVTDPVVKQECGSCHMVFPPQFLPKRSWQKLLETLSDHFGENASLDEAHRKAILDYLLANAADSPKAGTEGRKFGQSIAAGQTPLRITDTPRWVREHREVQADRWQNPTVKSKANCLACHKAAEQGIYEDEEGH
jgi:Dihaem cytochrome c